MRCPHCSVSLLAKSEGKLKLRVPILVFSLDGAACVTSCPKCKREIQVPVTLQKSACPPEEPTKLVVALGLTRARAPT